MVSPFSSKCASCGKQHVPGFVFCQRCGSPLDAEGDGQYVQCDAAPVVLDAGGAARLEAAVMSLLADGNKSDALRLYRETMHTDVGQAAAAIDSLEARVAFVPVSGQAGRNGRNSPGHGVAGIVTRARAAIRKRFGR